MSNFIPLSVPNFKGNELKYVSEAIETEWVSTAGAFITKFEKDIAEYLGVEDAVACQSGTAGLHLALQVCGVERGDEVLVPTLTFIAAVNPVRYLGAEPVFMDCDDTLTMDVEKFESFCTKECTFSDGCLVDKSTKRKIKAVVVVHVFGNMANIKQIKEIALKYNLKVIEDATEALGTRDKMGRYAGTFGDIGVYSFNGNKIITTGGGGMIVSNDSELREHCRHLSTQAKADTLYFEHDEVGYNYRMTNIQAALGLAQLEQLEDFIEIKRRNYFRYVENGISLLEFRDDTRPNYWFYSHITDKRDEIISRLQKTGIQTRPIWQLIHMQKMYKDNRAYEIEKAVKYYEKIVNIPCSSSLSLEDVDYISDCIKRIEMEEL